MQGSQVLIIDDDKETTVLFSTVLGMVGFNCDVALSAKEALARLAASVPDLILLDMRLGLEIGGEDILYQIRANPRFDNTRVIVITAHPNIAELVTDLSDLILIKPVEIEQLKTLATRLGTIEISSKRFHFRDPVTQLFNREFFHTRLELAFERSKRRPEFLFAVLVFRLQLSDWQEDQVAPEVSISIFRGVAERLRRSLRPTDTIARFSGWEFATLHEELKKREDVDVIIRRIEEKLSEPYPVGEEAYKLAVSFGAATNEPRYKHPEDILEAAEQALKNELASG